VILAWCFSAFTFHEIDSKVDEKERTKIQLDYVTRQLNGIVRENFFGHIDVCSFPDRACSQCEALTLPAMLLARQSSSSALVQRLCKSESASISAAEVRESLPSFGSGVSDDAIIKALAEHVLTVEKCDNVLNYVDTEEDLIQAMALDMKDRNGRDLKELERQKAATTDKELLNAIERKIAENVAEASFESSCRPAAATAVQGNSCRGFTAINDQTWFLGTPKRSDVLHECLHVLTVAGGLNELSKLTGLTFMEGVNQYFTRAVFNELKKRGETDKTEYAKAYPKALEFVEQLVRRHGIRMFYQAHFKGDVRPLKNALLGNWVKCLGYTEKKNYPTEEEQFDYLIDRLENPINKKHGDVDTNYTTLQTRLAPTLSQLESERKTLEKKLKKEKKKETKLKNKNTDEKSEQLKLSKIQSKIDGIEKSLGEIQSKIDGVTRNNAVYDKLFSN